MSNRAWQQFDPMAASPTTTLPGSNNSTTPPQQPLLSPTNVQYLQAQGFPAGMLQALSQRYTSQYPVRIFILDNSHYMATPDAHILQSNNYAQVPATRWQELCHCVLYHADLAMRLGWPTRFALVNTTTTANSTAQQQHLVLNQPHAAGQALTAQEEFALVQQSLQNTTPAGPAAVLHQLQILRDYIASIQPQLQASQQTVPIIICTQGLLTTPQGQRQSGQELIQMLQSFEQFNVSFVLRLCTDDEQAFEFYNALDAAVRLPLDVLDDFYGEALEVYLRNPWLCYALVLHRFRELGCSHVAVLDVLDERALHLDEVRALLQFLFGVALPFPATQWTAFWQAVQQCMGRERPHWNPVLHKVTPWLDLALLQRIYGPQHGAASSAPPPPSHAPFAAAAAAPPPPTRQQYQQPPPQQQQQQQQRPPQQHPQHPPPPQQQQQQQNKQPQVPTPMTTPTTSSSQPTTVAQLNTALEQQWSKLPPTFAQSKPLAELLATIHQTFALAPPHPYFDKFHAFSRHALVTADDAKVLKKAVRKVRLFLHPDKLPADLNEMQQALCRTLWDVISEAWSAHEQQQQ